MSGLAFNMTVSVTKSRDRFGPNNIVDLKMSIFNNADVNYFIKSIPSNHLDSVDHEISISGPSQIPCQLSWDDYLDPNEQASTLKIPAGGHINSGHFPLSGACYFTGAIPGTYTVSHSIAIQACMDENLQSCLDKPVILSGQGTFDLS